MKVYQFKLKPTKQQLSLFKLQLEAHRLLYNECLESKKLLWESAGVNLTCFDLIKSNVKKYKGKSNYSSLQQTVRRLDKSYKAFFKKNSKFPRFKGVGRFNTIDFAKHGDGCKVLSDSIYIQYIGNIKCIFHRTFSDKIKTLSVTLRGNDLFVNIICDTFCGKEIKSDGVVVGIDFGIKATITTSNGEAFTTPKFTKSKKKDVARLSRRKNYKALKKIHKKIRNQRKDFNHKLSKKIVDKYDIICLEELKSEGITTEISNINSRIYDIAINQLIIFIKYKAENAGKKVIMVNPHNTTKTCSRCGNIVNKTLEQRQHICTCGLNIDRDVNAALNIKRVGLHSQTQVKKPLN